MTILPSLSWTGPNRDRTETEIKLPEGFIPTAKTLTIDVLDQIANYAGALFHYIDNLIQSNHLEADKWHHTGFSTNIQFKYSPGSNPDSWKYQIKAHGRTGFNEHFEADLNDKYHGSITWTRPNLDCSKITMKLKASDGTQIRHSDEALEGWCINFDGLQNLDELLEKAETDKANRRRVYALLLREALALYDTFANTARAREDKTLVIANNFKFAIDPKERYSFKLSDMNGKTLMEVESVWDNLKSISRSSPDGKSYIKVYSRLKGFIDFAPYMKFKRAGQRASEEFEIKSLELKT